MTFLVSRTPCAGASDFRASPSATAGASFQRENDGAPEQIRYILDLIAESVNSEAPKVPENVALSGLR